MWFFNPYGINQKSKYDNIHMDDVMNNKFKRFNFFNY